MTQLSHPFEIKAQQIEQELERLIPLTTDHHRELMEAARYAILGGGKRVRPLLALSVTEMLGAPLEKALVPACALEMVHAYSLIHDDLPCMDDDDYRRGKLTVHRQFSEGLAVLTGDYLLTYAFETIAKAPDLGEAKKMKLIALLAHLSGSEGMIGGQVMDLASEGKEIALETLELLHRRKTGALLAASIEFGAIIGDASADTTASLHRFGRALGLGFQIVDDILDVTSSHAKHGRTSDLLKDKSTYVTLLGLEKAQQYAEECYQTAIENLEALPYDTAPLVEITGFIIHRNY